MKNSKDFKHRICGKVLASVLAVSMLASFTAVGASAATTTISSAVTTSSSTASSVTMRKTADFEYYYNSNGSVTINKYIGTKTAVTIPSTIGGKKVTEIGEKAFYNKSQLLKVTIPSSVKAIGQDAFSGCKELTNIKIPDSVTSLKRGTFTGCKKLSTISGGNGLLNVEGNTLDSTLWYKNKPNGVVYIGKALYKYKGTMPENTTVNIKDGTIAICKKAFYGKSQLLKVTIPSSVKEIGQSAFYNCTNLKSINIPDSVTSINGGTFTGCEKLSIISGGNGLLNVEGDALDSTLWYKNKPNGAVYIGKALYKYKGTMPKNTTVNIKTGTIAICEKAFYGKSELLKVTIPSSVKEIGQSAFYRCKALKDLYISNGVKTINSSAFSGCKELTKVNIPNSVVTIGANAFINCNKIESVAIGNGCTNIGERAFESCTSIRTVTLGNSLKRIGDYAFCNCQKLNSITIPKSVNYIGKYSFDSCAKYAKIPTYLTDAMNAISSIGKSKIILRGYQGSYVEKYAKSENMIFVPLLENVSSISASSINLNKTLTLRGSAKGGVPYYKYVYSYKKTSAKTWTTARAYSTNSLCSIKPTSKGTYDVCVKVKDKEGTEVKKFFTITVK